MPKFAARPHLGAGVQLLDEETPGPQVGGGEAQLHHLVLLLAEDEHELLLLDGHRLEPVGQDGPRLLGQQAGVQVNEGQQSVNLKRKKGDVSTWMEQAC